MLFENNILKIRTNICRNLWIAEKSRLAKTQSSCLCWNCDTRWESPTSSYNFFGVKLTYASKYGFALSLVLLRDPLCFWCGFNVWKKASPVNCSKTVLQSPQALIFCHENWRWVPHVPTWDFLRWYCFVLGRRNRADKVFLAFSFYLEG